MKEHELVGIIAAILYAGSPRRPDEDTGAVTDTPVAECAVLAWKILSEVANRAPKGD